MTNWYSAATAGEQDRLLAAWADAPAHNQELCTLILSTAQIQVLAYAPEADLATDLAVTLLRYGIGDRLADVLATLGEAVTDPPVNYVLAQLQQARNLWNAGRTTGDGDVGPDGFVFRPYPLDKTIKQMIRPIDGTPHVL